MDFNFNSIAMGIAICVTAYRVRTLNGGYLFTNKFNHYERQTRVNCDSRAYLGSKNEIEADRKPQNEFTSLPVIGIHK